MPCDPVELAPTSTAVKYLLTILTIIFTADKGRCSKFDQYFTTHPQFEVIRLTMTDKLWFTILS